MSVNTNINVISFNMGTTSVVDGGAYLGHINDYNQAEVNCAEILTNSENRTHVYLLQEAAISLGSLMTRPLLKKLQTLGYEVMYTEGCRTPDTVIALDTNRFTNIKSASLITDQPNNGNIVATATCKLTNVNFAFFSGHIPKLDLTTDHETMAAEAKVGDEEFKDILTHMNAHSENSMVVGGFDLNADNRYQYRLDMPKAIGATLHEPIPYTYYSQTLNVSQRLDYFVTKAEQTPPLSLMARIKNFVRSIFFDTIQNTFTPEMEVEGPLKLGISASKTNPSNHRPIHLELVQETTPSYLKRIVQLVKNFFHRG